jgi:hypothetical protein
MYTILLHIKGKDPFSFGNNFIMSRMKNNSIWSLIERFIYDGDGAYNMMMVMDLTAIYIFSFRV